MRKYLILILTLTFIHSTWSFAQIQIPQLKAGVYVNDSIDYLDIYFHACQLNGQYDVDVIIDSNLIPIATGVELKYVVTILNTMPDSVYTLQNGIVHLFDTLSFSAGTRYYRFYSTVSGYMQLKLMLVGTPTIPLEVYSCELSQGIILPICKDGKYIFDSGTHCVVEDFNEIHEFQKKVAFRVFPNPAFEYFEISSGSALCEEKVFKLYSLQGQEVYSETIPAGFNSKRFQVECLSNGFYFWKVYGQFEFQEAGKLLVNRRN